MTATVTLHVQKIRIQKDEYQTSAGNIGETEFWRSNENQAEVLQFKRALATCRIEGPFSPVEVELVVSLRAGFVRVRVLNTEQGYRADAVAGLLQDIFGLLHHTPGYSPAGVLAPIFSKDKQKYMLCKTYDPHWLIATLHEIKDEKSMGFSIEDQTLSKLLGQPVEISAHPPQ